MSSGGIKIPFDSIGLISYRVAVVILLVVIAWCLATGGVALDEPVVIKESTAAVWH